MTATDRAFADEMKDWRDGLATALVEVRGLVPVSSVDWDEFHRRLARRAVLPLTRLRQSRRPPTGRAWWKQATGWISALRQVRP